VDANSAYHPQQALQFMHQFAELGVSWMEEPVAPNDLDGLRFLRQRAPVGMELAEGEYGYGLADFRRLLEANAVDVLMADATRCLGISGFLKVGALCEGFHVPLSTHCAPALHAALGCAVAAVRHAEYFYDHVRIEQMLLDGAPKLKNGALVPSARMEFKHVDAEKYREKL
jgi:L-alanine-DL-glutamate epimerase-like enolase superfamily enzyme